MPRLRELFLCLGEGLIDHSVTVLPLAEHSAMFAAVPCSNSHQVSKKFDTSGGSHKVALMCVTNPGKDACGEKSIHPSPHDGNMLAALDLDNIIYRNA
jgi:hypothetical protein